MGCVIVKCCHRLLFLKKPYTFPTSLSSSILPWCSYYNEQGYFSVAQQHFTLPARLYKRRGHRYLLQPGGLLSGEERLRYLQMRNNKIPKHRRGTHLMLAR